MHPGRSTVTMMMATVMSSDAPFLSTTSSGTSGNAGKTAYSEVRSRGGVAHQQQLNARPQRYARFIMTKHSSSCAQVLLAHDTSAETLQHRHKTMQDLYILRLMVSNDTRLDMTVAIIIVNVDLP